MWYFVKPAQGSKEGCVSHFFDTRSAKKGV